MNNSLLKFLESWDIDPIKDSFKLVGSEGYMKFTAVKSSGVNILVHFKIIGNEVSVFNMENLTKQEKMDLINTLYNKAWANNDIAGFLGVSQSLVSNYIKLHLDIRTDEAVSRLKIKSETNIKISKD